MDILRTMLRTLDQPRAEISPLAPRLLQIKINPSKIGAVIGPGGKVIRNIEETSGARVEIDDDGSQKEKSSRRGRPKKTGRPGA